MRPDNEPGPLQTFKLMLTALGILFLGVSVFAYAWGGQSPWSLQGLETPTDFLRELRQEGMDCRPQADRSEVYDCQYRQPGHPAGSEGQAAVTPGPFALAAR